MPPSPAPGSGPESRNLSQVFIVQGQHTTRSLTPQHGTLYCSVAAGALCISYACDRSVRGFFSLLSAVAATACFKGGWGEPAGWLSSNECLLHGYYSSRPAKSHRQVCRHLSPRQGKEGVRGQSQKHYSNQDDHIYAHWLTGSPPCRAVNGRVDHAQPTVHELREAL